jgi:hypothetical protein
MFLGIPHTEYDACVTMLFSLLTHSVGDLSQLGESVHIEILASSRHSIFTPLSSILRQCYARSTFIRNPLASTFVPGAIIPTAIMFIHHTQLVASSGLLQHTLSFSSHLLRLHISLTRFRHVLRVSRPLHPFPSIPSWFFGLPCHYGYCSLTLVPFLIPLGFPPPIPRSELFA